VLAESVNVVLHFSGSGGYDCLLTYTGGSRGDSLTRGRGPIDCTLRDSNVLPVTVLNTMGLFGWHPTDQRPCSTDDARRPTWLGGAYLSHLEKNAYSVYSAWEALSLGVLNLERWE
jgi:hypothetical protein